jgi:HK97 family phage major capsid protein
MEDVSIDLASAFLQAFVEAVSLRLDYACFRGDGTADETNGGITGIFADGSVAVVTAAAGNTTIETLDYDDLANVLIATSAAILQRSPRWWIFPELAIRLMKVRDGSGRPVLKTALETENDTVFSLLGFPCELTAVAPSSNTAGSKVAAFGDGAGYGVAVRKEFTLENSRSAHFNTLQRGFRALSRARGQMKAASAFTILKLAAA